nr:unnamed protein product [Haemonchus contortus]
MMLKQLHKEHEHHKEELTIYLDNFVLAYEWYEILVAANEVEELSRLEFLQELKNEVDLTRTALEEPGYPEMAETRRRYRQEFAEFTKRQIRYYRSLLDGEKTALEEAKHHSQLVARLEEETMLELRSELPEVRSKVEDLEETMHKLERECQVSNDRIVDGMEANQRTFTRHLHEKKCFRKPKQSPTGRDRRGTRQRRVTS